MNTTGATISTRASTHVAGRVAVEATGVQGAWPHEARATGILRVGPGALAAADQWEFAARLCLSDGTPLRTWNVVFGDTRGAVVAVGRVSGGGVEHTVRFELPLWAVVAPSRPGRAVRAHWDVEIVPLGRRGEVVHARSGDFSLAPPVTHQQAGALAHALWWAALGTAAAASDGEPNAAERAVVSGAVAEVAGPAGVLSLALAVLEWLWARPRRAWDVLDAYVRLMHACPEDVQVRWFDYAERVCAADEPLNVEEGVFLRALTARLRSCGQGDPGEPVAFRVGTPPAAGRSPRHVAAQPQGGPRVSRQTLGQVYREITAALAALATAVGVSTDDLPHTELVEVLQRRGAITRPVAAELQWVMETCLRATCGEPLSAGRARAAYELAPELIAALDAARDTRSASV